MTTLPELSRRVSEAEGPSRELDGAIYDALSSDGAISAEHMARVPNMRLNWLPRYTASLDVVAALIAEKLPGWMWRVDSPVSNRLRSSGALAKVDKNHDAFCGPVTHCDGATPALALLAAALLATHERKTDDHR